MITAGPAAFQISTVNRVSSVDLLISIGSILNVVVEILIIPLNNNVVLVVCILFNCSNSSVISFIPIFPIFHENQSLAFLLCIFCLILQIEVWKPDFLTNSLESRLYLYFGSQVLCQIEIYIYFIYFIIPRMDMFSYMEDSNKDTFWVNNSEQGASVFGFRWKRRNS